MSLKDDIMAKAEADEAAALVKDQEAAHGSPPTSNKPGDEIVMINGKPYGKHTGLHQGGKGEGGVSFEDVYGKRTGPQRMDRPAANRGESGIVKTS